MKILVVLFKTLGDVLMGTTVVHALKQKYPDSKIDFITGASSENILEGNPDIENVIIKNDYFEANMHAAENDYDEVFRLGMSTPLDSVWHHIPEHQNQHMVEWYAKRAGLDKLEDKNIYIALSEDDILDVEDYWEDLPTDKKIIAMHTSTGAHFSGQRVNSKDWPVEFFSILAAFFIENGFTVVQLGAFNDKKIKAEGVIDLTGKFSFKQNAEVIKRCDLYVGLDSGPSYLAGWANTPSVVLMGATQNQSDEVSGPGVGSRNDNITYINPDRPQNPACRPVPCYVSCKIEGYYGCIVTISVEHVITSEPIKKLLLDNKKVGSGIYNLKELVQKHEFGEVYLKTFPNTDTINFGWKSL